MSKFGPKHSIMCFPPAGDGIEDLTMFDQAYIVSNIPARWPLNPSYMHTFGKHFIKVLCCDDLNNKFSLLKVSQKIIL